MDKLFLLLAVVIAVVYLYFRIIKNRGCGCGKKGCSNQKLDK